MSTCYFGILLVLVAQSAYGQSTCSSLLLKGDRLNATDKRNAGLCRLLVIASNLNDVSTTLMAGLAFMLDEEGVQLLDDESISKRKTEFMRFGKRDDETDLRKRKTEFMRFGKRQQDDDEDEIDFKKRKTEFMRFGKRDEEAAPEDEGVDLEKRKTEFLRFGKRKTEFMRFGKRKFENQKLRFGK